MLWWEAALTAVAVGVALLSLLTLRMQHNLRDHERLFAVVSGSLALSLMSPFVVDTQPWLVWMVAIGGSVTCNGFWLVSRTLFRGDRGVRRVHLLLAASVAILIAIHRGTALQANAEPSMATVSIDALLTLSSTSLLALSFVEPLRGWSAQWTQTERSLRIGFMILYGSSVLSTTLLGELAHAFPTLVPLRTSAVALCAMLMIAFMHHAFRLRRLSPAPLLAADRAHSAPRAPVPAAGDATLIAELQRHLSVLKVYREPELKVAQLAERLGTVEHRLSKLITQHTGERNFNQLLNRHRVAHACALLAAPEGCGTILQVSSESGFASLGPFNRAFKSMMGCTPTAYRARCLAEGRHHQADTIGYPLSSNSAAATRELFPQT
ncbi:MAG: helix-turn-helix domain-containing protein [Lysobacterales bacterium]|nr:AraC family transcriptional regulator [Xanthomonadales bacterium]